MWQRESRRGAFALPRKKKKRPDYRLLKKQKREGTKEHTTKQLSKPFEKHRNSRLSVSSCSQPVYCCQTLWNVKLWNNGQGHFYLRKYSHFKYFDRNLTLRKREKCDFWAPLLFCMSWIQLSEYLELGWMTGSMQRVQYCTAVYMPLGYWLFFSCCFISESSF